MCGLLFVLEGVGFIYWFRVVKLGVYIWDNGYNDVWCCKYLLYNGV